MQLLKAFVQTRHFVISEVCFYVLLEYGSNYIVHTNFLHTKNQQKVYNVY